jgi:hypothetical protein
MQTTSPYYEIAYHFADYTNRSLFLTGKAGTGKTTFLRKLKEQTKKKIAIVAPTGVAAINAGGVTIHSFFQLPLSPFIPTEEGKKELVGKIKMNSGRRKVLHELELLVIDEISMVRADVMDEIDTVLRHFRRRKNEPFGGVQMIFIGDMYQLSPVYNYGEWQILSDYYQGIYFFDSLAVRQQPPVYIEFDNIFRQSNLNFIRLLNEVRNNEISDEGFGLLQSLYKPGFKPDKNDTYITLTTHNYKAESINSEELTKLKGESKKFKAKISGDYPEKSYPTELELEFKIGAKVMFLKNDKETPRRYFNGKIGEITSFANDKIEVKCPDEAPITVVPERWENISYSTSPETKQIKENLLGTFDQYPLRLAWAITIHKSQGLTFDKAIIDAGQAFTPGQVYVALSRCRSLEGMVLLSQINRQSLHVDKNIILHSKQKLPLDILNNQLDSSKKEYQEQVLFSIFDFKESVADTNRLIEFVKEKASSFNSDTLTFLFSILAHLSNTQNVALRFQSELQKIISTDEKKLQDRISAACTYFSGLLQTISVELKKSPAITDSKVNASNYNDVLGKIFGSVGERLHIFNNIKEKFNIEQYFTAKETLVLPPFQVNAFAGANSSSKTTAKYPVLFYKLMDLRRSICDAADIPVYMVASTVAVTELATFLPQTLNDMLKISGFGPATVSKYGQHFLDIILEYCYDHNLESLMHEKVSKKKTKSKSQKAENTTTKLPKEDSKKITLDLYKQGFTIDEIAEQRGYVNSTIKVHLAHYVKSKELPLRDFVSEEHEKKILAIMKTTPSFSDIFTAMKGEVGYTEIGMVAALNNEE